MTMDRATRPRRTPRASPASHSDRGTDRMADSLKFEVPPYESFLGRADTMLAEGYLLYALPDPADG